MVLTFAIAVGGSVGAVVGLGALQLPVPPLVQSLTAVLVAVLLSAGITSFLGFRNPGLSGGAGEGYFAFGSEDVVSLSILLVLAFSLHGLLGVFSLACLSGVYGSASVIVAFESLAEVNLHDVQTTRPASTLLQQLSDDLVVKHVAYDESKILSVTRDGLEYVDDEGATCTIDFHTCHENVLEEVSSPGWIRVRESHDIYVGFRDFGHRPPYMAFASDPPTCFQFPMPEPVVAAPGQVAPQRYPEDFREFIAFKSRLIEAGVTTLDLS